MVKLLVVTDRQGNVKAAAKLSPEHKYSPTMIEVKSDRDESMHEVELPDELEATALGNSSELLRRNRCRATVD